MIQKSLNDQSIERITSKLSRFLADSFLLYVKTLNFHWNMVGAQFFMYHKLLEDQYKELAESVDIIAERIRQLGHKAPATLQEFLKLSHFKEPQGELTQDQMVIDLAETHAAMVEQCHTLIDDCEELDDQGTTDIIVDQIRFHAKQAWLLRSHQKN